MAKTSKPSPPKTAKIKANRVRRRVLRLAQRLAVQKEKTERAERHAAIDHEPRAGKPRTRRPSRR
ncbi:hypothetical protein [Nonomuraea lactucae]|uniref:hypothetical protein n=1 Tax=Nonomuraea lactucae TaxID=2249762 RepID=UPI000DE3479F|nr:hypothetical protein [Nonomuraea lactucae]